MRKSMTRVLLLALILALLCVGAMAADTLTIGQTETQKANYTITPLTESGATATLENGKYVDVAKFKVEYSAAEAGEQLVMLLLGEDGVPTANNIYYIDQQTQSASGTCTFTIYPKQLTSGTYKLLIASKTSEPAATIEYEAAYILGDVNEDQVVNAKDATMLLKWTVDLVELSEKQQLAADANGDKVVNAKDVTVILKWSVS